MTPDQLEAFNERAAIMEYDGGCTREDAEKIAELYMEMENEQRIKSR